MKDRWVGESFCLRQSSLILTDISGALRNLIWGIRVLGSILISLSSSDAFAKLFVSFLLLFVFNENFLIFRKNKIKTPPSRGSPGPFFWSESWARYPAKVIASLALAQVCSFWKNNHLQKFQREEDGLNLKYKKNNEIDFLKNKNYDSQENNLEMSPLSQRDISQPNCRCWRWGSEGTLQSYDQNKIT